jgi:hypothetical protein
VANAAANAAADSADSRHVGSDTRISTPSYKGRLCLGTRRLLRYKTRCVRVTAAVQGHLGEWRQLMSARW